MSLASQARHLNDRGAKARQDVYGANNDGDSQVFRPDDETIPAARVYFTFVRDAQQLEDANMRDDHSIVLHVVKSLNPHFRARPGMTGKLLNTPPRGETISIRFDEFPTTMPGNSPEFVIGCASLP